MRLLLGCSLLCLCLCATASPPRWQVDTVHSKVLISVDHAGFSHSLALLPVASGVLVYDPALPADASIEVLLEPARLDFGDARWNAAVHGNRLLAVEKFPQARFVSRAVTLEADGSLRIDGELELRGRSVPVQLLATRNGQRRHPMPPFRQTVGFSAQASLSRAAFGADAWSNMVGDTVHIRIELEATADAQAALPPAAPAR